MSVLQTSLNTPLPSTNGQLWIGNTGSLPSVGTLSNGTNIGITNGAGTISIGATGGATFTWQNSSPTLMTAFNGYINNASTGNYTLPTSPNIGDIYIIQGLGFAYSIVAGANQHVYLNANAGTTLTTSAIYAAITILCINNNPTNMQFPTFVTNAATFTIS